VKKNFADFTKQHRAIMAKALPEESEKEKLALAVFNNMVTLFEDHPHQHRSAPRMYSPDYVSGIDHPGDM
jgi:hypothetical protein